MVQTCTNENEDCIISVKLEFGSTSALCSTHISNKTNKPLYFFNLIYFDPEIKSASKDIFYSYIERDTLILSKSIVPVPLDMDVEKPILPGCTKIMPNSDYEERIEIKIPINHHHPYENPQIRSGLITSTSFRFGYFVGQSNTDSIGTIIKGDSTNFIYFDPFDYNYQKIIEVKPFKPLDFK